MILLSLSYFSHGSKSLINTCYTRSLNLSMLITSNVIEFALIRHKTGLVSILMKLLKTLLSTINNLPYGVANLIFIFQIDYMMSSYIFLLYCLLAFSLYSPSQHKGYSLDVKLTRKLTMSIPVQHHETQHNMQEADKAMDSTLAKEDSVTPENISNSYTPPDLIYHIDYHGVTTHPTPKHPKP
ncbi:hypothetical protein RJT34_32975 [Clitoria ternatea]|uniref:Uncharacterized protein n=1 Tax=Clitoria ternatea TaxID=43366 RepID=A0AAN9EXY2_CLITE